MHSIAIASIMVAAATLTSAAPAVQRRANAKLYYTCANNGFRGDCSVDPCALTWCPDYEPNTYTPVKPAETANKPAPQYYVCAANGFRGVCSVDPCALPWCPDVPQPAPVPVPAPAPATKKEHYVCASNGFNGDCTVNACNLAWCPDYAYRTYTPLVVAKRADPTVCAPGTGYFQSCSNGFRGCCTSDACGSQTKWCPDYKPWTFEPATKPAAPAAKTETVPKTETIPKTETAPVVSLSCAPGTGFYQVCGNGFKGCCKYDACSLGYCPSN